MRKAEICSEKGLYDDILRAAFSGVARFFVVRLSHCGSRVWYLNAYRGAANPHAN